MWSVVLKDSLHDTIVLNTHVSTE